MENNKSVKINLTVAEINQILEALGQQPYIQVYQLIASLQQQAQTQLQTPSVLQAEPVADQPTIS